jgi:hypothetical protein
MVLVVLGIINTLWMGPLMSLTFSLIDWVLTPLEFLVRP